MHREGGLLFLAAMSAARGWAGVGEKGLKSLSREGVFCSVSPRQHICPHIKGSVHLPQPGLGEMMCLGFHLLNTAAVTGLDTCQAKAALPQSAFSLQPSIMSRSRNKTPSPSEESQDFGKVLSPLGCPSRSRANLCPSAF